MHRDEFPPLHRIHPPAAKVPALDAPAARRWGFEDSRFVWDRKGVPRLTGTRYPISGVPLPNMIPFAKDILGVTLTAEDRNPPREPQVPDARPAPALEQALVGAIGQEHVSTEPLVRLRHGHGHTATEIFEVNYGKLERVPDLVVMPGTTEEVAAVVAACAEHGAIVIPFGGGTSVTGALRCRTDDPRIIVSLDLARMSRIKWIDPVDHIACIEGGAIGRIIQDQVMAHGFTLGHEPDSIEFSTLGGWIATRASGMKRNRYGNIEEVIRSVKGVTRDGEMGTLTSVPRASHGIEPQALWFGSEGALGVITEATVRLHPAPPVQRYGSYAFPDWETGLAFLHDLQHEGHPPASTRMVDNTQLRFSRAMRPEGSRWSKRKGALQRLFLDKVKGFELSKVVALTLVYEGSEEEVALQERSVKAIAKRHRGVDAGSSSGSAGYKLTFGIAYIRDFLMEQWVWGESFETAVSWRHAKDFVAAVKKGIRDEHARLGLPGKPFITGRISQIYPEGVCTYFYVGFVYKGVENPAAAWDALEAAAREAMIAHGAATSHHHGIGQVRTPWLHRIEDDATTAMRAKVKDAVDPDDVFGVGNQGLGQGGES